MRLLAFVLLVVIFSSCVSNKKVTLLQKGDVAMKNLPVDSMLRTYAVDTFEYKIQPNDILSVRFVSRTPEELDLFAQQQSGNTTMVQGNPLLLGELVDETGNIPFPVIGKVKVAGLTIFEAQDKLQKLADQYVESPVVKVRLLNYRIIVLGEVTQQGAITLTNNRVNMLEAIALAGGLGELADRTKIKLIRQKGSQTEVQYLNVLDEDFIKSPYFYVYQGDVLIVPALKQRPFRKYFGENVNIFNSTIGIISSLSVLLLTLNLLNE